MENVLVRKYALCAVSPETAPEVKVYVALQPPEEVMVPLSGYLPFASVAEAWTKVAVMVEVGPGALSGSAIAVPVKVPVILGTEIIVSAIDGWAQGPPAT
jgi:hypothetical protein